MTVSSGGNPVNEDQIIAMRRKGYSKMVKDDSGMIMFTGDQRRNYDRIVLVPETHPAFNGGILVSNNYWKWGQEVDFEEALTNIVKRAFFTA